MTKTNLKVLISAFIFLLSLATGRAQTNEPTETITRPQGVQLSLGSIEGHNVVKDTLPTESRQRQPIRVALRTNTLFYALLAPNIGAELSVGKKYTVAADWFFTWFSNDDRHRYWQAYGGYLTVRKYFGRHSDCEDGSSLFCFTGHHVGVYLSALTYDLEWGGKGYQAARLGFGGGVEYGYSKRIGRRLNLDFNIGIGFQDGEYKEYEPVSGRYLWLTTRKRHWFGPTKAEISLVWLLGPARKAKGGRP